MKHVQCSNCRFYVVNGPYGYCHRYPPTIVILELNKLEEIIFPVVAEDSWCGEFKCKEMEITE